MKKKNSQKNKKILKKQTKESNGLSFFPPETKQWIWGLFLFLLAVIVTLSFFNKAGVAGEFLIKGLSFLIGKATILVPLTLVLGGIVFLHTKYREFFWPAIISMIILILGISGMLGSINPVLKQGGQLGFFISLPVIKLFGGLVAKIIFGAIVGVAVLVFWYLLGKPIPIKRPTLTPEAKEKKPGVGQILKKVIATEPKFKAQEVPGPQLIDGLPSLDTKSQPPLTLEMKPLEKKVLKESYQLPLLDLLEKDRGGADAGDIQISATIIKRTLQNFDIQVEMSEVNTGPTVTQYTFKPAEGVKLSKITALSNDLSLALASHPIRIEAPIPGRPLVGVEVPNKKRSLVRLRNLLENPNFQNSVSDLTFALGRDVSGLPVFADLARMPHLLVAGSTGTGKTICLNSIILSLLYRNSPQSLKLILVDPKRVEFTVYNDLPHLLCPVIQDPQKTINALKWLTEEMERRFETLSRAKARDIGEFNQSRPRAKLGAGTDSFDRLPYIILIVDELADLMAARGREMEAGVVRLAQMARAVGIHLLLATQRPSVEVITGLIKANITSRITFQVASQVDSRTVLDMAGAEKLLGLGDLLFVYAEIVKPRRIQGVYISPKEVNKVVDCIVSNFQEEEREDISREIEAIGSLRPLTETLEEPEFPAGEDPLYGEAKRVVIEARKASASLLQRRLRLGYARAARLIDTLEERGVVGPGEGAKPRKVYLDQEN